MRTRKRKEDSFGIGNKKGIKRKKINNSLNLDDNDDNKIIHESIEIIKLTDLEDEDDDEDKDCDWEDVSELSCESDVIINLNKQVIQNNESRKQLRKKRDINGFIKKIGLMSLFARVLYINKIISNTFLQHLALSRFPYQFIELNFSRVNVKQLQSIVRAIKSQFVVTEDYYENGNVFDIIKQGLIHGKVSKYWINVVILSVLRSVGILSRLVGLMCPQGTMLQPPTKYRASTRGNSKQTRTKNKKCIDMNSLQPTFSVLFVVELLDHKEDLWIPLDATNDMVIINDVPAIVDNHPRFIYAVAVDNSGYVKDVAARYDDQWAESSRRCRISVDLWNKILSPFLSPTITDIDRLEDEIFKSSLLSRGIPHTLVDLKGHPLFVLSTNLLKYQVIYPPDTKPFGFFNETPVYLRDNVRLAHTRETWLKEAMVIKQGEMPCKRVKTMMSTIKHKANGTDPLVDLFGPWQIEKFTPPKAVNGIVPINSHGNVDLFQPCMIPEGCVHIRMKGIDKVAKRLNINFASAMVGWDFVKGNKSRPVLDGWVVCKEHVKVLTDALIEWNRAEAVKRAAERQRIVIKRWEILTRRILLKDRLWREYKF